MTPANQAKRRRQRMWLRVTTAALLASLAALVVGTVLFARQTEQTQAQAQRQADLNGRLRQLQTVLVTLGEAETGQRGFLLSGRDSYLLPYEGAVQRLPQLLQALEGLSIADAALDAHVARARDAIAAKFEELADTVRLYRDGQRGAALALFDSDRGLDMMEAARTEIHAVLDAIRTERDGLNRAAAASSVRSRHLAILTVSTLVAFVLLAGVQIYLLASTQGRFERALADSEQRYRAIVEEQAELVSLARDDGTLTYANPAYARQFMMTPEAMVGMNLYDLVEPVDRPAVRRQIEAVLSRAEVRHGENRIATPDGSERWIAWTHRLQAGPEGERLLHSVGRDVTQRRQAEAALRASEDFIRQITDSLPLRISYLDTETRYRFVNLAHCHRFGKTREEIVGRLRHELSGGVDPVVQAHFDAALQGRAQRFEFEEATSGAPRQFEGRLIPDRDASGAVRGVFATAVEITERLAAERTLRAVIEAIPAMVAVFDAELRYRLVNSAFERWKGVARDEIIGRTALEILGPEEYERSLPHAQRALAGETVTYEKDYPGANHLRHMSFTYIPMWREDGRTAGFIGVAQDITPHREEKIRLLRLSERDPLTGLLNRAGFEKYLTRKAQQGECVALLYVDLDRFKPVNDDHGHPVGDEVLRQFAQRLQGLVRPTDAVARIGGDEFALVLAGLREQAPAEAVADKVIEAACAPFEVGTLRLLVGASVGVAAQLPGARWQDLVAQADAQLYRAKTAGRGQRA